MKTPKEYVISRYPGAEGTWQQTGHDDNFMCQMMQEYANECNDNLLNIIFTQEEIIHLHDTIHQTTAKEVELRARLEQLRTNLL